MSAGRTRPRAELLLVDNDATIGELIAWVLTRSGYSVRTATSFADAEVQLCALTPDLVLSDVDLGAESALVELPRLAAAGLLPPTLVVSGYLDDDKRALLGRLPAVLGFLDKPFDPRGLEECVEAALAVARGRASEVEVASEARDAGGAASGAARDDWRAPMAAEGAGAVDETDDGWIEIGGES